MASQKFETHLGRSIESVRSGSGLSTPELAERAGLNPLHLSLIEEGKADPHPSELDRIAQALRTSVERLRNGIKGVASHFEAETSISAQARALKIRSLASEPEWLGISIKQAAPITGDQRRNT